MLPGGPSPYCTSRILLGGVDAQGGPLTMVDHNEVFNTGYAEGDGGVMYSGAIMHSSTSACLKPSLPAGASLTAG